MASSKFDWVCLRDSREKSGHGWTIDKRTRGCLGTEIATLQTGDYTVKGLEDIVCIERKLAAPEWHNNLFAERDRFKRELDRMKGIAFSYVLLEFPFWHMAEYPHIPTVPHAVRKKIQITADLFLKIHLELERDHPWVRFHFVGDCGKQMATSIMRRAIGFAAQQDRFPAGKGDDVPQ